MEYASKEYYSDNNRNQKVDHFIYILINPAMPGLLKIGKTNRTASERANELSTGTGVPSKFVVAYELRVKNCDLAERIIHKKFENYRYDMNREFFALSLDLAISLMNDIIVENNLEVDNLRIQPYKFKLQDFFDSATLARQIKNDLDSWELGKIHFEKGHLQDWLKKKREFDSLIYLENAAKQNDSVPFLLSVVIHSLTSENKCSFLGISFDLNRRFLREFINGSKLLQEKLLDGELLDFYKGYLFSKKLPDNNLVKTLRYISKNGNSEKFEDKLRKINVLIEWHSNNPEYPYLGSLSYKDLSYLIEKSKVDNFMNEYIIPVYVLEIQGDKERYLDLCKMLYNPIKLNNTQDFITKKDYDFYTKNHFVPEKIIRSITNGTYDEYKEAVRELRNNVSKYPAKEIIYREFLFKESFEKALVKGVEIPMIEKSLILKYQEDFFIPEFIIQGLISERPQRFIWSASLFDTVLNLRSFDKIPYKIFDLVAQLVESFYDPEYYQAWEYIENLFQSDSFFKVSLERETLKSRDLTHLIRTLRQINKYYSGFKGEYALSRTVTSMFAFFRPGKDEIKVCLNELYNLIIYLKTSCLLDDSRTNWFMTKVELAGIQTPNSTCFFPNELESLKQSDFYSFLLASSWFKRINLSKSFLDQYVLPESLKSKITKQSLSGFINGLEELQVISKYSIEDTFIYSLLPFSKQQNKSQLPKLVNEIRFFESNGQNSISKFIDIKERIAKKIPLKSVLNNLVIPGEVTYNLNSENIDKYNLGRNQLNQNSFLTKGAKDYLLKYFHLPNDILKLFNCYNLSDCQSVNSRLQSLGVIIPEEYKIGILKHYTIRYNFILIENIGYKIDVLNDNDRNNLEAKVLRGTPCLFYENNAKLIKKSEVNNYRNKLGENAYSYLIQKQPFTSENYEKHSIIIKKLIDKSIDEELKRILILVRAKCSFIDSYSFKKLQTYVNSIVDVSRIPDENTTKLIFDIDNFVLALNPVNRLLNHSDLANKFQQILNRI